MAAKRARAMKAREEPVTTPIADARVPTSFTREWVAQNTEAFKTMMTPPIECPICMQPFSEERPARGPITGDRPTTCRHFVCKCGWVQNARQEGGNELRCAICREDITGWMISQTDIMIEAIGEVPSKAEVKGIFKDFIARSVKLALCNSDVELASVGNFIFETLGGTLEELVAMMTGSTD